ncbi:MAG TPA: Ig-like domain-containing protein [Candidatus Polarisedimenticolaceae bacterium]|nr:Ig-like domain-containing protein [Candidatus Polarisedimenticolaceae bacterium]
MQDSRFASIVRRTGLVVSVCAFVGASSPSTLAASDPSTGELFILWDPPSDRSAIDGYRVYYSQTSRDYSGTSFVEVADNRIGGVRVFGIDDCTDWHFVVRSYNETRESRDSNEVFSWPRPRFTSISLPNTIDRGQSKQFELTGASFKDGDRCEVAGMQCQLTVVDCRTAVANVTALSTTPIGPYALAVTHVDSGVSGVLEGALQVLDPDLPPGHPDNLTDVTPPTIGAVLPRAGSSTVVLTAHPTVEFTEAVFLDDAVIELTDSNGLYVPIELRRLDGRTLEIVPQDLLDYATTYTLRISEIRDVAGNVQQDTLIRSFTTEADPATTVLGTPFASIAGPTNDDVVWSPGAGAQYYEVWRCIGANCWVAQNTETHFPSVVDRSQALEGVHHVGLDGEFLPPGVAVLEFVNSGLEYTYKVRACKSVDSVELCGAFSNELYYTGRQFMCTESGHEIPCYPDAPLATD